MTQLKTVRALPTVWTSIELTTHRNGMENSADLMWNRVGNDCGWSTCDKQTIIPYAVRPTFRLGHS